MLEGMTGDLLQRLSSVLDSVLEKSNLAWNSIDRILAVGGAARTPSVTKLIWKVTGRIPDAVLDHAHCIAEGAAYYALKLKSQRGDLLTGKAAKVARKILIRNVTSFSLGVVLDTPHGQTLSHTIIPDQSPLPAKVTKIFALQADAKKCVRIRVVEGDPRAGEMRTLGVCSILDVPAPADGDDSIRVATTYSLSEDGELAIEACDARSGAAFKCKIDRLIAGVETIEKQLKNRMG
jgi:molecular chaperone DnaK